MGNENKPVLTFITGVNGAGKSTYMVEFQKEYDGHLNVFNPDSVAKKLLATNPDLGPLGQGKGVVKELDRKLAMKQDLAIETTLSGASMLSRVRQAKKDGYKVNMVFVSLDKLETHIQRVAARVKKGGHDVPTENIERRFRTSYDNLKKILPDVDNLKIYDNTGQLKKVLEITNNKVKIFGKLNPKLLETFPALKKAQVKPDQQRLTAKQRLQQQRQNQVQGRSQGR